MTRRCSHCSNNGHNSRTCPARGGVKLFGVRLTDGSIRKSASMGSLSSAAHFHSSSSAAASPNPSSPSSDPLRDPNSHQGYASDDPTHASSASSSSSNCRKKGVPWTEEEHRMFLVGLQKLGKGDWRGIARNFVVSRSPTQVASHAQKYFIRQNNGIRRKRRSSLFDMVPDMSMDPLPVLEEHFQLRSSPKDESESINQVTPLNLFIDQECEAMESASNTSPAVPEVRVPHSDFPPMVPKFFPTYMPIPFPFLPPNFPQNGEERGEKHQVLKPTPVLPKDPIQVDELLGLSKLSIGEGAAGHMEPSALSIKLLGASSRQSAFHANPTVGGSDLSPRKSNAIHAL